MTRPVSESPLVSVGVPTYNRPELLQRALDKLLAQTYSNLEIIVSDNASSNPRVAEVVDRYRQHDPRIRSFRQSSNIGAMPNFLFVLNQAQGDFFMWAADDDDWSPDFIQFGLDNIGSAGLVVGDFETVFHARGEIVLTKLPALDPEMPVWRNAEAYIANMQPSMIYGLHRTECLRASLPSGVFDFWDCALIYAVLLKRGIRTVPGVRYRAGVHAERYEIKLAEPAALKLKYKHFLSKMLSTTVRCRQLSVSRKVALMMAIAKLVRRLMLHHKARVNEQFSRNNEK